MKVRFSGTVSPGQTLLTEMWNEREKVLFQTRIMKMNTLALSNGAVVLVESLESNL